MKKVVYFAVLILVIQQRVINGNKCGTEDCLIGKDLESEFSFGSHVARMLYQVGNSVTGQTGNNNNAAVKCPQSQSYRSCLPSKNGGDPNKRCELPFGSHVAGMLYDVSLYRNTGNRNNPAISCPRGQEYSSCLPSPNVGGTGQRCD
ncbi:hypothetical protein CR513_51951, partial [Mucuna pruriens]